MKPHNHKNILRNENGFIITELEKHYIKDYTASGYRKLNKLFSSHGIPTEEEYINFINIWNVLDRNRLEETVTVYRGITRVEDKKVFFQNPEGTDFNIDIQKTRCFTNFMSTSASLDVTYKFTEEDEKLGIAGIILAIRLKKNGRAMSLKSFSSIPKEEEILVAPGFLKILRVEYYLVGKNPLPYKFFVCDYNSLRNYPRDIQRGILTEEKCMMSMPIFQIKQMIDKKNAHCYENNQDCGGDLYYCYTCNLYFCENHQKDFHIIEDDEEKNKYIHYKYKHYIYNINNILKNTFNPENVKATIGMRKSKKKSRKSSKNKVKKTTISGRIKKIRKSNNKKQKY